MSSSSLWLLDTDAFLLGPLSYDVFGLLAARNATYGYVDVNVETPAVADVLTSGRRPSHATWSTRHLRSHFRQSRLGCMRSSLRYQYQCVSPHLRLRRRSCPRARLQQSPARFRARV